MDCISLLFAKGFPSTPAPKLPSCFFADCHWKQAIFHPHGGSTQECSGTADLAPVPCPHDPPTRASIPLLCQSGSLGSFPLFLYPCLQSSWAEMNMSFGRGLLHKVCSRLPPQLCWGNKSPVTYTPAWVTHLPEKVLCSPKQSCLENDEGTYQMKTVGANQLLSWVQTHSTSHLQPEMKCGAATPGLVVSFSSEHDA